MTGLSAFESWLLIAALIVLVASLCALVSSPRSGVTSGMASSAVRTRRNGDQQDHATFVFRPVEAKRRRLTAAQRRARRRSLQRATRLRGGAQ